MNFLLSIFSIFVLARISAADATSKDSRITFENGLDLTRFSVDTWKGDHIDISNGLIYFYENFHDSYYGGSVVSSSFTVGDGLYSAIIKSYEGVPFCFGLTKNTGDITFCSRSDSPTGANLGGSMGFHNIDVGVNLFSDFHEYGVKKSENKATFYLDNKEVYTVSLGSDVDLDGYYIYARIEGNKYYVDKNEYDDKLYGILKQIDIQSQTIPKLSSTSAESTHISSSTNSAISATSSLGDPTHFVISASILQNSISTTSTQTTLAAAETIINKAVSSSTSNATTTSTQTTLAAAPTVVNKAVTSSTSTTTPAQTTLAVAETVVNKVAPSSTTNSTNSFVIGIYSTAASSANNSVVIDNLTVNQADDAIPSENADASVSYISTTINTSQGTAITEGVAIIVTTAGNIKSYTTSLPIASLKVASAGTVSSLVSTSSSAVPHLLEAVANDNGVSSDSSTHSSTTLAAIAVSSVSIQHSSENSVSSLNFSNRGSVSNVFEKWIICILPVIFVTFI